MASRSPLTDLPTHVVANQPPPLEDINLFTLDAALTEGLQREGAGCGRHARPALEAGVAERPGSEEERQGDRAGDEDEVKALEVHGSPDSAPDQFRIGSQCPHIGRISTKKKKATVTPSTQ